ncbi:hypothetical protein COBT_002154 [Conglomerata obtusa]
MNSKKTLGGKQKLTFAPKKPPQLPLNIPKQHQEVLLIKPKEKEKRKIVNKPDVATFTACKREEQKKDLVIELENDDDFIEHDEMIVDYHTKIAKGFENEKMCLMSGFGNGIFYVNENGILLYEENGVFQNVACTNVDNLSVVSIEDNVKNFGNISTCYSICRNK